MTFGHCKRKKKKENLQNSPNSSHTALNRQDGVHELPEALIPKEKCSRDAQNGYLKAEEGRGKLVARTYKEGKGKWDKWE